MTAPLTPAQIAEWRATHMLAAHAREIADSHDRLSAEVDRRFGIGGELEIARRERDAARAELGRLRYRISEVCEHAGIHPARWHRADGTVHVRTAHEDGRNEATIELTDRIEGLLEESAARLATPGSSAGGNDADLA